MRNLYLPSICRAPEDGAGAQPGIGGNPDPASAPAGGADQQQPGQDDGTAAKVASPKPDDTRRAAIALLSNALKSAADAFELLARDLPSADDQNKIRTGAVAHCREAAEAIDNLPAS